MKGEENGRTRCIWCWCCDGRPRATLRRTEQYGGMYRQLGLQPELPGQGQEVAAGTLFPPCSGLGCSRRPDGRTRQEGPADLCVWVHEAGFVGEGRPEEDFILDHPP